MMAGGPPGAGTPPGASPDDAAGAQPPPGEYAVPLTSLAQPDDQEAMQTPGQGDSVSFQVDATITQIVGEQAFVKPMAINGTPLPNAAQTPTPEDTQDAADASEGAGLQQEAQGMS